MYIDQSDLASAIVIFSSILIGFVVALWLVLVIWTYRDIRSRTRDKLVPVLACIIGISLIPARVGTIFDIKTSEDTRRYISTIT